MPEIAYLSAKEHLDTIKRVISQGTPADLLTALQNARKESQDPSVPARNPHEVETLTHDCQDAVQKGIHKLFKAGQPQRACNFLSAAFADRFFRYQEQREILFRDFTANHIAQMCAPSTQADAPLSPVVVNAAVRTLLGRHDEKLQAALVAHLPQLDTAILESAADIAIGMSGRDDTYALLQTAARQAKAAPQKPRKPVQKPKPAYGAKKGLGGS